MSKSTAGFHFYAEMPDHWVSKSGCKSHPAFTRAYLRSRVGMPGDMGLFNCVAVLTGSEHRCHDGTQEALSSVFSHADSDTNLGSVSPGYLANRCVRIDADLARKLHPRLLARIDAAD